jgi:hypothetical protein
MDGWNTAGGSSMEGVRDGRANAGGSGGGCARDVKTPIPIDRIGDGARMLGGDEVLYKFVVSISALDVLDSVLL